MFLLPSLVFVMFGVRMLTAVFVRQLNIISHSIEHIFYTCLPSTALICLLIHVVRACVHEMEYEGFVLPTEYLLLYEHQVFACIALHDLAHFCFGLTPPPPSSRVLRGSIGLTPYRT